ncbi:MAG: OmpA family protein, partial [Epsilonproteobacteria bacterium]|nr:OmpA family protein [Campylobacterota bacterium]
MKKALLLLLGLLLIGVLAYFCFMDKSTDIKEDLISKTEATYKNRGLQGIKVGIKGEELKQTRIITLNGEVASEGIKKEAGEIASNIDGVMGVENNLIINSSMALANTSKSNSKFTNRDIKDENVTSVLEKKTAKKDIEPNNDTLDNQKDAIKLEENSSTDSNREKEEENLDNTTDNDKPVEGITNTIIDNNMTEKTSDNEENNSLTTTLDDNIINDEKSSDSENSITSLEENSTKHDNNNTDTKKVSNSTSNTTIVKTPAVEEIAKDENKSKSKISTCQNEFKELLKDNKIHFAYNEATIRPESYPLLDRLIQATKNCPNTIITIAGHTDSDGNEAYNQRLSENR